MNHFSEYPHEPHRGGTEGERDGRVRTDESEGLGHRTEKSPCAFGRLRRGTLCRDEPLAALWPPLYVLRRDPLLLGLVREQAYERVNLCVRQTRRARVTQEFGADGRAQVSRRILCMRQKRQDREDNAGNEKKTEGRRATHESSIPTAPSVRTQNDDECE